MTRSSCTLPQANNIKNSRYRLLVFLALVGVGLAGNHFRFSILNAEFVFGSIFAMLALQFLGLGSGIVAAVVISSYTYLTWNHPYAILTMTAEVAVVGWLIGRRRIGLVGADAVYWVAIGIPMGCLCFIFLSHLPPSNAIFLMTKQAINGVANCIVARAIFIEYSVRSRGHQIPLREIMSTSLVFFALFTGLIMLTVGSRNDFAETDLRIRTEALRNSRDATNSIQNWLEDRETSIVNLAGMAETFSPAQMQLRLEQVRTSDKNFLQIALFDREATAVAYSPAIDELGLNTVGRRFGDRPYLQELKEKLRPMLSEVLESRFGRPEPIAIMLAPVVSRGSYEGYVAGVLNLDRMRNILAISSTGPAMQYTLLDRNGYVLVTSRKDQNVMTPFSRDEGTLSRLNEGIFQWIPKLSLNTSFIELWGKSFYIVESVIGKLAEWKLIVEQPVAPFQEILYGRYALRFSILFLIVIALLALAELLSRRMVSTTEKLAMITVDLPVKLESRHEITWPESPLVETNNLIRNFRVMADSLLAIFTENRQINESLEQLVKKRTQELETSQEQFKQVFESANVGKSLTLPTGKINVNKAFCNLLGYTQEELENKTWQELSHPEEIGTIQEILGPLLSGEKDSARFNKRYIHKNGSYIWTDVSVAIRRDPEGKPLHFITMIVDVTARKKAEDALAEAVERYRQLIELSPVAIAVHSEGKIVFANPAGVRLLGADSEEQIVGKPIVEIIHPDGLKEAQLRIQRMMAGEQGLYPVEDVYLKLDGTPITVEVMAAPLTFDGKPAVQVIVTDVTVARKAEEAQRRLATAIDQATEGVIITDSEGTILYVNPAVEIISGYGSDELIGNRPSILKSGEHDVVFYQQLWNTIKTGNTWSGRFTNRRKDGCLYYEDATITPVKNKSGQIINFVGLKRDITENLELSKQLLQAQKMEAVGTLTGGIAHDFNNILQVVLGYSEWLLSQKRRGDAGYDELRKVNEAGKRGADLVQNLMIFSRKVQPNFKPLNLNDEVVQIQKLLTRTIPKTIKIDVQLSGDLRLVEADISQMGQVLMNLAVNARDAMPDGGILSYQTANVELAEAYCATHPDLKPGMYVLLTVSDTGTGIDEETLFHIFEPFFTTKEVGKGTGLGLATAFGIVKQHKGHITCSSEIGHGTTFKIYLPAVERNLGDEGQDNEAAIVGGTETILLVDDEEHVRDLASTFLVHHGYRVLAAENGKDAIEIYQRELGNISLTILDVIMPKMDGEKCLAEILRINPTARVLIASGHSQDGLPVERSYPGAKGFVAKPYDIRKLLQSVRKVLDERDTT